MLTLRNDINRLQQNLIAVKNPVVSFFNPPLEDVAAFSDYLKSFYGYEGELPQIISELYSWHNGTDIEGNHGLHPVTFCMFPDYVFASLDRIMKHTKNADEVYEFVKHGMLPIFFTPNGEYLCINLKNNDGMVYYSSLWSTDLNLHTSMFDSISTLFATVNEAYEKGAYYLNEDGVIWYHDNYDDMAIKMNPKSEYWKIMV